MENPILKLKEEQKERAVRIRNLKNTRPQENRGTEPLWKIEMQIKRLSYDYRHYHIAYCEFRGRERYEIERTTREDNKAIETLVDKYKENLTKEMEEYNESKREIVCDCAA